MLGESLPSTFQQLQTHADHDHCNDNGVNGKFLIVMAWIQSWIMLFRDWPTLTIVMAITVTTE